eukprot:449179_1
MTTEQQDSVSAENENATELIPTNNNETEQVERININDHQTATVGSKGVLFICLLQLFSVIIFLRTPWVIGQTGVRNAIVMLFLSAIICSLTTASMSIICKAGNIMEGGPYFMISRACGPIIGGAIGYLYCLARMIASGLFVIEFTETWVSLLGDFGGHLKVTGDVGNDVRVWSCVFFIIIAILIFFIDIRKGLKMVINILKFLFALILIGIFFVFIGSFYKKHYNNNNQLVVTAKGWSNGNLNENFQSNYQDSDWGRVFIMFFPAFASLTAGADISGDLIRPTYHIPRGTLMATGISSVIYMFLILFIGAVVVRDELINNLNVILDICVWKGLIYIALFGTLLGSVIISLITAPRLFKAMAKDKLFPICCNYCDEMNCGKIGYLVTFFIGLIICAISEVEHVKALIFEVFLLTNVFINIACICLIRFDIVKNSKRAYVNPIICVIVGVCGCLANLIIFWVNWIYAGVVAIVCIVMVLVMVFAYYFGGGKENWDWDAEIMTKEIIKQTSGDNVQMSNPTDYQRL